MDRSACFGGRGSVILDHLLLLCTGGLHHRGGGVKRGSGHLDATNERTQVGGHGVDGVEQCSGFVRRDSAHLSTEVTAGYLPSNGYRRTDGRRNGTCHKKCSKHDTDDHRNCQGEDHIALEIQQGERFAGILLHQHAPSIAWKVTPRGHYFSAAVVGRCAVSTAATRGIVGNLRTGAAWCDSKFECGIVVTARWRGNNDAGVVALHGDDLAGISKTSDICKHSPNLFGS